MKTALQAVLFCLLISTWFIGHDALSQIADSCSGGVKRERFDTAYVNRQLPRFILHTMVREQCCTIDVFEAGRTDTIQRIVGEVEGYFPSDGLEIVDANFDGYKDIVVFYNAGNTTNEDYAFWLFNPRTRRFEYNQEFTEAVGCNPVVNEEDQTIYTGGMTGCLGMCYVSETYEVHEDRLALVERISQELVVEPTEHTQPIFVRTLERLKLGKLTVIARIQGTIEEIDKKAEF